MNFSAAFIARPIATTLLTIGLALAGAAAFFLLPVSPLPNVDYPTISVTAQLPGASPETVATSVATPLERHLGTISDVTEMTSSSSVGQTRITLQFDLSRDIDGAARDVQAAINAARVDLPADLRANPTYRKVNPADFPILILALTSDTLTTGQIYDSASTILQQKLSQISGVGEVQVGGSSLPAVRVELNPRALFKYGIGLEDVRAALASANANAPKGAIEQQNQRYQIYVNDTATDAADYRNLIIAYRDNAAVRLKDIADVNDSVENIRNVGIANGKPAVLIIINRQPGANIIDVVDRIKALVPEMQASIPPSITITPVNDRTTTIRRSLQDVEQTIVIAVLLVIVVVFVFLRNPRSSLVPSVAVPLSLLGTFGAMYLLNFSLDNLSLMALTIATGFVVDDAIVMLENISRHVEDGMPRMQAALLGAQEVGFTVLSMSVSLIAVFLPILLMGGIIGRLFHEFAETLSLAIMFSLILSLTTTPMMCAHLRLSRPEGKKQGWFLNASERVFARALRTYDRSLSWSLANPASIMVILALTIGLNVYLFTIIPMGFFPQQDTGNIAGAIRGDQAISFQLMQQKFRQFEEAIRHDPAVQSVVGFSGGGGGPGGQTNSGNVFISLKPLSERKESADHVIARMRKEIGDIPGARLFLQPVQDLRIGGRQGNSQYQYTIQADSLDDINTWVPKITTALQNVPELEDVNSDRQEAGLDVELQIDRATAARLGLTTSQVDATLYDAFGQRQVSTIYKDLNQYHVVMEVAPEFWQNPETLRNIYVSTSGVINGTAQTGAAARAVTVGAANASAASAAQSANSTSTGAQNTVGAAAQSAQYAAQNNIAQPTGLSVGAQSVISQQENSIAQTARGAVSLGTALSTASENMVPLSDFSHYAPGLTPLSVNHQGPFVATTFSFNLPEGESLGTAVDAIQRTMAQLHVPITVHGEFAGNARAYQRSLANEPFLIAGALVAVYIVLGVLYESLVHPLTILSTLPSAGVGAVLALMLFGTEFSLIAMIGVILLIGIVKKNAIMMIDFALSAERNEGLDSRAAIYRACLLRFRPIMMTTMAAIFAALPLALITGDGAELRQPLGISIVGGLIVSQLLTLYTTPVVYLYLDRFSIWSKQFWHRRYANVFGVPREA